MPRHNPIGKLKDIARSTLEVPLGATRKTVGRVAHTATGAMGRGRTAAGHVTKSARNQAVETAAGLTGLVRGRKRKPPGPIQPGPRAAPAVPRKSQGDPVMPTTTKAPAKKTSAKKPATRKAPAKKAPAKESVEKAARSAKEVASETLQKGADPDKG